MPARTAFLSRLIGLYCILMALAMASHRELAADTVTALLHNAPLLFVLGAIVVIGGLAMVLGHNVWSGGPPAVVVSIIGWATLIKGVLFLFLSPEAESEVFLGVLHYAQLFYVYVGFSLVLGIYLTYAASRSAAR
jgi:hypothetical protein